MSIKRIGIDEAAPQRRQRLLKTFAFWALVSEGTPILPLLEWWKRIKRTRSPLNTIEWELLSFVIRCKLYVDYSKHTGATRLIIGFWTNDDG